LNRLVAQLTKTRIHDFLSDTAAAYPDDVALIDHADNALSWSDLVDATGEAAALLQAHDVGAGDRILLVFENCPSVVAFLYAASRLDVVSVVVNARITGAELQRIVTHCDAAAVIFSTNSSPAAVDHAESMHADIVSGAFGKAALVKRDGSVKEQVFESPEQQVAVMLYTSGTTGNPKAAMLTHQNLISGAIASAALRGSRRGDVCYVALPLSHIFGLVTVFAMASSCSTIRLEPRFNVERLFDALQSDVTILPAVPQMHAQLFQYARERNIQKYDHGLLRYVSSGAAPLDPVWKREAEAFYGVALQNGYGLTETAAGVCATVNSIGEPDVSVGVPMGDCELKLDFSAPGATPDEGVGEILVRGTQIMKGYFRNPEQTAAVFDSEGYFRTGDLGRYDDSGHLHIAGRSKELIIRSGFNVYPVEVEAALIEHPDVVLAAVVGRAVTGNEEVLAFVQTASGATITEDALKQFVQDKLAPYKRPARVVITDKLPAAATGKILKANLVETFAKELAQ
jgi:acyl-CoA synthetase (AMP-forming)/AMP-acid ligase II